MNNLGGIYVHLLCCWAICSRSVISVSEDQWRKTNSNSKNLHLSLKKTQTLASPVYDAALKSNLANLKGDYILQTLSLKDDDVLGYHSKDEVLTKKQNNFFSPLNLHQKSIYDERLSPYRKWEQHSSQRIQERYGNATNEKETKIAQIFMGVAYGSESKKNEQKKLKPVFLNNYYQSPTNTKKKLVGSKSDTKKYFVENYTKPSELSQIVSQPKRVQKSLKKYKVKSLVREEEDPLKNIDFSLPQLFLSSEEKSAEVGFYYHKPTFTNKPEEKISLENITWKNDDTPAELDYKDDTKYNASILNVTAIIPPFDKDPAIICLNHSLFYFDHEYLNWTHVHLFHSNKWFIQDHIVLVFFCAVSFLPLFVLFHLQIMKRNHVTPKYCVLLMIQLLIVCWSRIVLYSVDPFGVNGRFPQFVISAFHIVAQSSLICSVGLFLVILVFPVYRPKSLMLPRFLCLFFLALFLSKIIAFVVYIFLEDFQRLKKIQLCITALDFGEIGTLVIGYIFLNLCTRQRHKVWWIRLYRKSLSDNNANGTFSVLYSFLKRAIRFGTGAALIQLVNTFWIINVSFNLKLVYASLYSEPLLCWLLETTKRIFEGILCCFLVFGSCYLFVPKERVLIRKRSSLKAFTDIIKGKRRSGNHSSVSKMMQPLNIFTLNKNRKSTDYATTDFTLVWNQNPRTQNDVSNRRKSAKSLDFSDDRGASTTSLFSKDLKLSHSVDILNAVYESKCPSSGFNIYDNLQYDKNRTPIYQNQYFHYNYQPQLHDGTSTVHNVYRSSQSIASNGANKRKSKKKTRPKSCYVEEKPKINENYLTSYFSVLSMDKYLEEGSSNWSKSYSTQLDRVDPSEIRVLLPDEINSPMVSNEKWKDIKITPKSCTIKINSKNMKKKLSTSKSVDFF